MCQHLYAINLCCVYACPYNYGYLCSVFPPLCLSYFSLLFQPDNPDSQVTNRNHIPPHSFPSFLPWAPYTLHTIGPLDSCFIGCFAHAASLSVFVQYYNLFCYNCTVTAAKGNTTNALREIKPLAT